MSRSRRDGYVPSKVLIVKFGAIGDVVMALPAVHALHLQGATIDWICGRAVAPLLACYPWVRTIVVDDRAILTASTVRRAATIAGLWSRLAGCRYDLCATLYYDARYRVLTLPVRSARKLMLSRENRVLRLVGTRPHADEYARILLGEVDSCRPENRTPLRPERLPESPLPEKKASVRIGLVPGGASNMLRQQTLRRWPVTEYVRLTKDLLTRGYEVVLLGGSDDAWVRSVFEAEFSARYSQAQLIDAIGSLTLAEVIATCDRCDVVVSHDTGPMHLAGLSRAALVGLFGPTDPGSFLPRRTGVRGLWGGEGFACRPCYDGANFAPCTDNGCMQQISVEMVLRQVDDLIAERAAGRSKSARVVLPSDALKVDR